MKWTLISFLCIVTISNVFAQTQPIVEKIEAQSPVNIGSEKVRKTFTPAPMLKSATSAKSSFVIEFVNFPEEAKRAFQKAVSIWEQTVSSPVEIHVTANWEKLEGRIIAQSRPALFYKNFVEAPYFDVYYPVALAEKLAEKEFNDSKDADIICSFNSAKAFYFGIDGNAPSSKYDFVTVALHEIAHGLGISGFITDENLVGRINNPTNSPSAYDYYIFNTSKQRISDVNLFKSPSSELHKQITSDKLNFYSELKSGGNSTSKIYAPVVWFDGASIYHLSENQSASTGAELMKPFSYLGEAIHDPGKSTVSILEEIGWSKVMYKMAEIKDFEDTADKLPVQTKVLHGKEINATSAKIVFSTNNFATKDSVTLQYNAETKNFEGSLPVASYKGRIQYFFSAQETDGSAFTYPNNAPKNMLSFKIGPDYYPPVLSHNPSRLISNQEIDFSAVATDNVGISAVKIEYRVNGTEQEPFMLNETEDGFYKGKLNVPFNLRSSDKVEYRVVAEDNTSRKNKKTMPASGYYSVEVFEALQPVAGYFTDFNALTNDFITTDFEVNRPNGFTNGNLHTGNPYIMSVTEKEKYNSIAQLKYPVILEQNGEITFDEIVLVEPGKEGSNVSDRYLLDYVIVEASKDFGKTWESLVDGYDSNVNENWKNQFSNNLKSSVSVASGHENMFWQQKINITDHPSFSAGDTVLFRFRLASDQSVNGWGWAIDNLKIQSQTTGNQELASNDNVNVYPNPFYNNLYIDCKNMSNQSSVEVLIADLTGKVVYRQNNLDAKYNPKLNIDLSSIKSGVYLASITDADFNTITKRIIKH